MKTKNVIWVLVALIASIQFAISQTLSARTNRTVIDFSDNEKEQNSSFPKIIWFTPLNETMFQKSNLSELKILIESKDPMSRVIINVREHGEPYLLATKTYSLNENERYSYLLEQRIHLTGKVNEIEIVVENIQGIRSISTREVHVGETLLADAGKLKRTDYGLIIVTNKYDHWPSLTNPKFDGRSIAEELKTKFGFQIDILEDPSQEQIWAKVREYAGKKYEPLDQLFIFVAGHGHFDDAFKEGYLVTKESMPNESGYTSYISHNRLRNNISSIPCEHIFLTMDVCFGGTFDEGVASTRGGITDPYKDISQSEFITRKLAYRTRKYLTSGGKEYVSDGIPGHHSPFAAKVIEALKTQGGNDGILSLGELLIHTEKLTPQAQFGKFGDDAPGSEFVFVIK
jgi:hypothetical protein